MATKKEHVDKHTHAVIGTPCPWDITNSWLINRQQVINARATTILKLNSKHSDVITLKKQLVNRFFLIMSCDDKFDIFTECAVIRFQSKNRLNPNGIVDANTWRKLGVDFQPKKQVDSKYSKLDKGKLTWDSEGQNTDENALYYSLKLHVPTSESGLTLGRGYDMKEKSSTKIKNELIKAGVDSTNADTISKAAKLYGDSAKKFIINNKLSDFRISKEIEKKLFDISYEEKEKTVKRICTKDDVTKIYGQTNWDTLHPAIKEVLIDLCFRGDYDPDSRKVIQKHVAKNDLDSFAIGIKKLSEKWPETIKERTRKRNEYLAKFTKIDNTDLTNKKSLQEQNFSELLKEKSFSKNL